jgi:diketogulonate reductase-like aldo/keto reductase
MMQPLVVQGNTLPTMLYGTAWKELSTARLTHLAIQSGFRAIDTANQRKHYFEEAVGDGISQAIAEGLVSRSDLFLQTKFTHLGGQDHRVPYEPAADPGEQVEQSLLSSLQHLHLDHLDSYVLHGPSSRTGWNETDQQVWRSMESLQGSGKTRLLGVSNVGPDQLEALLAFAKTPPSFVQNRCFAAYGWDREIRQVCKQHGIVYQGFSLLTANAREMEGAHIQQLAARVDRTTAQVVFAFARQIGIWPMTGTTSPEHMAQDLSSFDLELSQADLDMLESFG